ncbi:MAG: CsgG/HfaB family protein [Halanaerobiales bacterium]
MVNKEGLQVIERNRIEEIIDEQDLGTSGRVDPATAAGIGKILGVDTMILGNLTRMEVKETGEIFIGPLEAN